MNLKQLGWNDFFAAAAAEYNTDQPFTVGRVSLEHKRLYRILTEHGELLGEVSGKFRHTASEREDFPAVGDWVILTARPEEGKATIHAVLPRQSKFSRKAAGDTTEEQIIATNINTVFLVNALNKDFNVRRIERYLLMAWESGANPVIILSKSDLCDDLDQKIEEVENVALGVPIHAVSATDDVGIDQLEPYLTEGHTVALLGSSGAGKSTLTNRLFGSEKLLVKEIREGDDKGRHTTTHRELVMIPGGGLLIDTPGMRELQLWEADSSVSQSFSDIEEIAEQCRFRDCSHDGEPGCAVKEAIDAGDLIEKRFENYIKLQRELAYLERKADKRAQLAEREKWKKLAGDRTRFHRR
ncbi:ribosome small subunit-dependent GTPase A [Pseudalkalibacillus caeni]|uniref:Small ribosomal subunit biogenesis GTPase RsgA n=1 Tax=Exobacillus caeni TaxID=2574798 RepID=A0A5R9EWM6_9BACL|nr:ribosome small subunit-dependent GTPase A [Pseudalkalibacillus caeni]TLS35059.1 ribosome small subunit-dependent GTPase A [Pseudalkalibacillus caeni]